MNCSACGTTIDAGSRFCKGCGQPIVAQPYAQPFTPVSGTFVRPLEGRRIAGVCAGIALHFGWDVTLVRLAFVLAVLLGLSGCLFYVIAWIVMPNGEYMIPPYPATPYPPSGNGADRFVTLAASPRPFVYAEDRLQCAGADMTALAEEFGTPLYVYSADAIAERVAMLGRSFAALTHTVCYAVKANSALAILKQLSELGCGFDIVSGGELERVKRAAPEALGRVVFSGVGKQAWEMDAALDAGILLFNVESEAELELLAERAQAAGKTARVAMRVNPDVFAETHPYISTGLREHKFGIGIERGPAVYKRAMELEGIEPAGVSVHIGSQIRSVDPFAASLQRVRALVEELRAAGMDIRYVDAGGGFGIEYGTAEFDPAARVEEYAAALRGVMQGFEAHLLLEPGRFLVAQAGALLTRVLYTKQNGAKHFVITDAAMNDLIRPALYQAHHEIVPVVLSDRETKTADIVGPVCESGDFFAKDRETAELCGGDLVALLDAGAYGMSLASQYNTRTRAAEVLVEGGAARLIRRRETLEDLFAAEIL